MVQLLMESALLQQISVVVWLLNILPDLLVLLFFLTTTVHVVDQPFKDITGMDFQEVFDTLCEGLKVVAPLQLFAPCLENSA